MTTQPTLWDDNHSPDELDDTSTVTGQHSDIYQAGEMLAYLAAHILDSIAVHPNRLRAAIADWDKAIANITQETP